MWRCMKTRPPCRPYAASCKRIWRVPVTTSPGPLTSAACAALFSGSAELTAIPYGAVMSYQGLAAALGQPKAVRAVAQALGHNPLAIVIPAIGSLGRPGI